jgi:hypothetical protein
MSEEVIATTYAVIVWPICEPTNVNRYTTHFPVTFGPFQQYDEAHRFTQSLQMRERCCKIIFLDHPKTASIISFLSPSGAQSELNVQMDEIVAERD